MHASLLLTNTTKSAPVRLLHNDYYHLANIDLCDRSILGDVSAHANPGRNTSFVAVIFYKRINGLREYNLTQLHNSRSCTKI